MILLVILFLLKLYARINIFKNWSELIFWSRKKSSSKKVKDIPLVTIYHLILQALKDIAKRNLNWFYADNEVKIYFHLDPWFHFRVLRNLIAIYLGEKFIPLNTILGHAIVIKNVVKSPLMLLKLMHLSLRRIRLIVCLIVVKND